MITIDPTEPEAPKVALWPADYIGPKLAPDHCGDVLAGSYDVPYYPKSPPTILDIGANIGAFARWAVDRWPGCKIHCYEPDPGNFHLLQRTVCELIYHLPRSDMQFLFNGRNRNIWVHNAAVADTEGKCHTAEGQYNCGETHIVPGGDIPTIKASTLPKADVLKIDTEGCEPAILADLAKSGRLEEFSAVMMEYHADVHLGVILQNMMNHGFWLVAWKPVAQHRGELKFINSKKRLDFILPPLSPV